MAVDYIIERVTTQTIYISDCGISPQAPEVTSDINNAQAWTTSSARNTAMAEVNSRTGAATWVGGTRPRP